MDKKLKMRKNMILYMFGIVAVLMGCFFYFIGKSFFRRTLEKRNAHGSGHRETDGINSEDIKAFFTNIVIVKLLV